MAYSYNPDYTITQANATNAQYDKVSGVDQVPIVLSMPGPLSIRGKALPYTVTVGPKLLNGK
jgi:hypothetical protein